MLIGFTEVAIKCTNWGELWKCQNFLYTSISTHQMIFQFNNEYSVQPQYNEALEFLIRFVLKWKIPQEHHVALRCISINEQNLKV